MRQILAYALILLLAAAPGARAQEDDDSGGMLVNLLENTLSGDNRNIKVTGLEGALSARATIEKLTVADDDGIWLTISGAVLDWNRLALIRGRFSVNELSAEEIVVERRPKPSTAVDLPEPEAQPFALPELPVAVEIGKVATTRLVLGETLAGHRAELTLDGRLTLADGALDSLLTVQRLDRAGDALTLKAAYANETRLIELDLDLKEQEGGLVATALKIPGAPPVDLKIAGTGPVEDFTADIALATDGETRVSGDVELRGVAAAKTSDPPRNATAFTAQLGGDLRPLIEPEFHSFFGPESTLSLVGKREPDGRLELDRFDLTAQSVELNGQLVLSAEGGPERAQIAGRIAPPDGRGVILPVAGGQTTVGAVTLDGTLDGLGSGDWRLSLVIDDLHHPEIDLGRTDLRASGTIDLHNGARLDGQMRAALRAIGLNDPALKRALGDAVTLETGFATKGDGRFTISGLRLWAPGMEATADGTIDGLDSGYALDGSATVSADDIARFSDLAGRPLGGAIQARLAGTGAPLSGQFDLRLDAVAQALSTGIEQVDALSQGRSQLALDAARGTQGLDLRHFSLKNEALDILLNGAVRSSGTELELEAELDDLARLVPEAPGPLRIAGSMRETDGTWAGQMRVKGPTESRADLQGTYATDSGAIDLSYDAQLNRIERFVSDLRGTLTSSGTVRSSGDLWQIAATASGPAATTADINGTWDQARGLADLRAQGQLQLAAANRQLAPMSVNGAAQFDLTLKGAPGLDALGGQVTLNGTSLAIPQIGNAIEGLSGSVTLADSAAQLALTGGLRSGGQFRVSGPVALTAPFTGRIVTDLQTIVLTDNISYETTAEGQVVFAGPMTGNATLSGRILFGETRLNIAAASGGTGAAPIPEGMVHRGEPGAVRATRARAGLIKTGKNGPPVDIGLDLELSAPNRVFVTGRGLNAELGGTLLIRGSSQNVVPSGRIELVRGYIDLFGNKLDLTEGNVTLQGDLEPFIEFQASTSTSSGQSTLALTGPLTAPEVEVYSSPSRPPEEALAMLVFGNEAANLSPFKIAQMASSLARLAGTGGGATESARNKLGVDTLDLRTDEDGKAELGAGAYVAENVYTDVTVNTQGETEFHLNLDVNDNLTLRGTMDSQGDSGLGVYFQRDY